MSQKTKRTLSIILLIALLCLGGCTAKEPTLSPTGSTIENETENKTPPITSTEESFSSDAPAVDPPALGIYDPEEYTDVPTRQDESAMVVDISSKTVSELLERAGEDLIVVTGRAYGNREGIYKSFNYFYTRTLFEIDKVFAGNVTPNTTITINEGYVMRSDGTDTFLYCLNPYTHSYLKNGEYVLMLLRPSPYPEIEGYITSHNQIPIGEDCDEWSEEYLTRMLDFFRGDSSTFRVKKAYVDTAANGLPIYVEPPKWQPREISNEDLIAEMKENLLIYLATELKIKIWPTSHVNYEENHCDLTKRNLSKWQSTQWNQTS